MKLSQCKKELANLIFEKGGWKSTGKFAAQDGNGNHRIYFYEDIPHLNLGMAVYVGIVEEYSDTSPIHCDKLIHGWDKAVLSKEEYWSIYQDWVFWAGGDKPPVGDMVRVEVMLLDGEMLQGSASSFGWGNAGCDWQICQYRVISEKVASDPEILSVEDLLAKFKAAKVAALEADRKLIIPQKEAEKAHAALDAAKKAVEEVLKDSLWDF